MYHTQSASCFFIDSFPADFSNLLTLNKTMDNKARSLCLFKKVHKDFPHLSQDTFNAGLIHLSLFSLRFFGLFLCHSGKLGALRLKVRLVEDRILPSVYYQPLIDLLVESVISPHRGQRHDSSAALILTCSAVFFLYLMHSQAGLRLQEFLKHFEIRFAKEGETHFFCLQHTHTQIIIIIIHYRILLTHHLTSLLVTSWGSRCKLNGGSDVERQLALMSINKS